jgi:5-methylcytosine-specific restriction enzyme B
VAKAPWCGEQVYAAAQSFRENCLGEDGSLFTPEVKVWTLENVSAVERRVGKPDLSKRSFIDKLQDQLSGLGPQVVQLGAELVYMLLLAEHDTGGAKRREHITTILAALPTPVAMPSQIDAALDAGGVAAFGAAKAHRDAYMRFLARLCLTVKELSAEERARVIDDPWRFRELVEQLRSSADAMEANALLHLFFPETFEYMVSEGHRAKLIETFAAAPGVAEAENTDRKIAVIRQLASEGSGSDLDLYEDPFHQVWAKPTPSRWEEAVHWAIRLFQWPRFDEEERTYKLEVAAKIAEARNAVLADDENWLGALRSAFTHRRNNLTSWQAHDKFLRWCTDNPQAARDALLTIWRADGTAGVSIRPFLEALPNDAIKGSGTRVSFASFLLMGIDATQLPFYKPSADQGFRSLLGQSPTQEVDLDPETVYRPEELAARLGLDARRVRDFLREVYPREDSERGDAWYLTAEQAERVRDEFQPDIDPGAGEAVYAEWLRILEELRLRILAAGTRLRDLLDAQGLAWWLGRVGAPDDWAPDERAAFEAFRQGAGGAPPRRDGSVPPPPPSPSVALPPASPELARQLHVPQSWLQRLINLLEGQRQVILYGPPGTGKTFIAQHIGRHIADAGGSYRLVQFHPSYTYEDFFEGYRPIHHEGGALSFELVPGALREIAGEAEAHPDRPHLLIIDEINRGNIAKIFGELYFLLEYRDEAIRLQYSRDEPFELPPNLFFIGTMNTADRSIALVDTALRRRFRFVGLIPTKPPIDRVLSEWLTENGLDLEPADLLESLNQEIGSEEFAIGPSYLMTGDGSAPELEVVWEHAIMPLLEEHYYGTGRDLEGDFGLSSLRKKLAAEADAAAAETDDDQA